ncbi:hypothetical protein CCH79_00020203 [Gambusia affinis]|uniref:Uncharacterized protein n=1 Tax=Gambusia affinis TaxID=33528 RepID=A0A315UVL3_GAMAF|nr:hypothetical protein CCH79_00020203 [Gambusia affinis]
MADGSGQRRQRVSAEPKHLPTRSANQHHDGGLPPVETLRPSAGAQIFVLRNMEVLLVEEKFPASRSPSAGQARKLLTVQTLKVSFQFWTNLTKINLDQTEKIAALTQKQ